jgi:ABC-type Mn2+/Zn2+ transport system ATPase subunit
MSNLLRIQNLNFLRQRDFILEDLSFDLEEGSITGLTGPNGGGKTTLFEIVLGLYRPSSGNIERSRKIEIAYVPQNILPKKFLPITLREFIEMATWGPSSSSKSACSIEIAIDQLHLKNIQNSLISELSGGEWKRAALARALVQPADLYLLDEPFNHLDLQMEDRIGHLLRDLSQTQKRTFFIISHDWHAMDHYFDRLILLNRKILADGSVRQVSEVSMNWRDPHHHQWMHP